MFKTQKFKVLIKVTALAFVAGLGLNVALYGTYFAGNFRKALSACGAGNASCTRLVNEAHLQNSGDSQRRLPKALIIGFSKCGTTALRAFLSLHPDIVSPLEEVRYFTLNYSKGVEWYRMQMPPSSEHQITVEKTPFYIMFSEALGRIHQFNSSIKLIVSVRDPIARLQSQYAHTYRNVHDPASKPSFRSWCQEAANSEHVVRFVDYATHIKEVYNLFAKNQVLILSEEVLEADPISVMKETEAFLGLRPSFSKTEFVFNESKGFYCFNQTSPNYSKIVGLVKVNADTGCIGGEKGRTHPEIDEDFFKQLVQAIRPYNEQLFQLIDKRFEWDNFK